MAFESLEVQDELKDHERCIFCNSNVNNEFRLGKIYKKGDVIVHYFCLLFSSHLQQNGADDEGILGFLLSDIKKEVKKKSKTVCSYCYQPGATSVCRARKCKIKFHFPCGVENYSLHTFYGQFRSYCSTHRRIQTPRYQFSPTDTVICVICQTDVEPKPSVNSLWASCCKTTWFHRECVQRLSLSAGYFFKCPNCNNQDVFRHEMLECGIYIPDQDAAWETEPNSFSELHERHNTCDADECLCPKGRSFARLIGQWRLILCNTCGSQGVHKECGKMNLNKRGQWTCCFCSKILSNIPKSRRKRTLPVNYNHCDSSGKKNVWSEQITVRKRGQSSRVPCELECGSSGAKSSGFQNKSCRNLGTKKRHTVVQRSFKRKVHKIRIRRIRYRVDEVEVLIPAAYKKMLKAFQIPLLSYTSEGNSTSSGVV